MRHLGRVTLLFVGIMVGCVTAPLVVPSVRAGTNPTRWEYLCFEEWGARDVRAKANKAGSQGWEMVTTSAHYGVWCFKRPLN